MKDFLGNELKVGDYIAFVNHQGNYLQKGVILKVKKIKLEIAYLEFLKSKTTVFPEQCLNIANITHLP